MSRSAVLCNPLQHTSVALGFDTAGRVVGKAVAAVAGIEAVGTHPSALFVAVTDSKRCSRRGSRSSIRRRSRGSVRGR